MSLPAARLPCPDPHALFALFPPAADVPAFDRIPGDAVPQPYHKLLVHKRHMTVTQEAYHGDKVDVRILERRLIGDYYARKILLALHTTGKIVQFGIPRINLRYCTKAVREEILAGQTPLGRILINHKILRRIEPTAYFRVTPSAAMLSWFNLDWPRITYGRMGIIYCDERPAIEVLEIAAPE
jgi:chorismate-pyruvate lyase